MIIFSFLFSISGTNRLDITNFCQWFLILYCLSHLLGRNISGFISSRKVSVSLINLHHSCEFSIWYVDFLCIHSNQRGNGVACEIIQYHASQQDNLTSSNTISIFKREQILNNNIYSVCTFTSYYYDILKFEMREYDKVLDMIVPISMHNFDLFRSHIESSNFKGKWDLRIISDVSTILQLINTKNMIITAIIRKNQIMNLYCFRKTMIYLSKNNHILSCFASECNTSRYSFYLGFVSSLKYIQGVCGSDMYKTISIENISHSNILIDRMSTSYFTTCEMEYYLYKYYKRQTPPELSFMLV